MSGFSRFSFFSVLTAAFFLAQNSWALNVEKLEPQEAQTREAILKTLEPVIAPKKQDGTAILLKWDELYAPLDPEERKFLDDFRSLRGEALGATSHYFGEFVKMDLAPVGKQSVTKDGQAKPLDPQYLPHPALESYQRMMASMKAELGKQLLVDSGYRSPAYQLYLFIFFMSNHDLSARETNKHVALPGHSEHGNPAQQAIDFINEEGINGEDHPEQFEALPEYAWLMQHANAYGFFLSYPRGNALNTAFEPWHWHYEASRDTMKPKPANG